MKFLFTKKNTCGNVVKYIVWDTVGGSQTNCTDDDDDGYGGDDGRRRLFKLLSVNVFLS